MLILILNLVCSLTVIHLRWFFCEHTGMMVWSSKGDLHLHLAVQVSLYSLKSFCFCFQPGMNLSHRSQGWEILLLCSVLRQLSLQCLRGGSEHVFFLRKDIGIWSPSFMGRWSPMQCPTVNEPWHFLLFLCALQGYENYSSVSPHMMHVSAKAVRGLHWYLWFSS